MIAALTALLMSTITINFRFPVEEMHACGNDRNVWLTQCAQIQLVETLPFRSPPTQFDDIKHVELWVPLESLLTIRIWAGDAKNKTTNSAPSRI